MKLFTNLYDEDAVLANLYLTAIDPTNGTTIRARSQTGIAQIGATPNYYLEGGLSATCAMFIWDLSGVPYPGDIEIAGEGGSTPIVLPSGGVSPIITQIFRIKRGDNEPIIFVVTELDSAGNQVVQDVTGWTGKFKMRTSPDTGSIILNQNFYISDADGNVTSDGTLGLIAYGWAAHETDTSGQFLAEFECHRADGVKKTYPTTSSEPLPGEYIQVHVIPDLDDAGSY